MPTSTAIFWPMIAHVVLVAIIYRILFAARVAAVKSGKARIEAYRVKGQEPEASALARASLENQFEMPVLFHVCCLALFVTGHASLYPVCSPGLSWPPATPMPMST